MKVYDIFTGEVTEAKFATQYSPQLEVVLEPCDENSITEEGYIPPEVQIKEMIDAGKRLNDYRRERFSQMTEKEEDLQIPDITLDPGADIVDIIRAANALTERVRLDERDKAEKARVDAEKAALVKFTEAVDAKLAELQKQPS